MAEIKNKYEEKKSVTETYIRIRSSIYFIFRVTYIKFTLVHGRSISFPFLVENLN